MQTLVTWIPYNTKMDIPNGHYLVSLKDPTQTCFTAWYNDGWKSECNESISALVSAYAELPEPYDINDEPTLKMSDLSIGDIVYHKKYGETVIQRIDKGFWDTLWVSYNNPPDNVSVKEDELYTCQIKDLYNKEV